MSSYGELGDSVILKGGLVVELRVERARTAEAIDLRSSDQRPHCSNVMRRRASSSRSQELAGKMLTSALMTTY